MNQNDREDEDIDWNKQPKKTWPWLALLRLLFMGLFR